MNLSLNLVADRSCQPSVSLRSITARDMEDIRVWKNANRQAFFFKEEISVAMQTEWFRGYLLRPKDFMFIVESDEARSGVMGFRIQEGVADCYNIIGLPVVTGRGIMTGAMRLMCSFILAEQAPVVGLKVLKDNPAAGWYQKKCCFGIVGEGSDYLQLRLDKERFKACAYEKISEVGK